MQLAVVPEYSILVALKEGMVSLKTKSGVKAKDGMVNYSRFQN